MKKIILILLFLTSESLLMAQKVEKPFDLRARNNININLVGDGSIISLNYERLFFIHPRIFLTGKMGIGYGIDDIISGTPLFTLPYHCTANFFGHRIFLETGLGGTGILGPVEIHNIIFPILGCRLQPLKSKRINLRVFICYPLNPDANNDYFFPPFGMSLGFCF